MTTLNLSTLMPKEDKIFLRRRGSWLISAEGAWQMASIKGPLEWHDPGREWYQVETASDDVLLVSRAAEERGMRELRLEGVTSKKAPALAS